MSIENLDKIFSPSRIAVFGASNKPTSVGSIVFRNLIGSGFTGVVYPVNPKHESVQGVPAYKDPSQLPHVPDLAVICTPAQTVPGIVRECGELGTRGILIISAGFRETGPEGRALEEEILTVQKKFKGMRILGPNCLGFMVPEAHLNASFAASAPLKGNVGFISQSGALCTSVLDWANEEGVGFSNFISIGNALDVGMGDLIDYLGTSSNTRSIILYVESIADAREFMSAARAFSRTKPIVAYKAGRFTESAEAATSHTGALAGVDVVYEAAFQRAGIERIHEVSDMFNCAELLSRQRIPKGDRLAVITNAGGPGVMTIDALMGQHGTIAQFTPETMEALNQSLPPFWSHRNPVDVLGDAPPKRFSDAIEVVLRDSQVDAILVILTPQAMTNPTATATAVVEAARKASKPVLAAWMGGSMVSEGAQILTRAGIPTYKTPEMAVRAFMHLVSYARNLEILHVTPRDIPVSFPLDRKRLRTILDTLLTEGSEILSENVSKAFLEAYGIPVTRPLLARSAEEAIRIAGSQCGYPVVMKIHSPDITHKTDVGGVDLNLGTDQAVRQAYDTMIASANVKRPDAHITGVTLQKMIRHAHGFELLLGAKKDSVFGTVIMVGMGGTAAEVFRDRALGLPPLNESLARRMLESLKSWPLLQGYRGKPGVDIDRLIEVIMRFSYLVADYAEIKEFDVNPLLVTSEEVIALDARVVVDRDLVIHSARPFSHLAISPYPEQYVTQRKLKDDTSVVLRPIRPEDEPMWHHLLGTCSPESLRHRFSGMFKQTTHEMATRFCFIDYDREIGIVVEVEEDNQRRLIGVGRLVADVDHKSAEYAVIVTDRWQGRGVGSLLLDYCLEVARKWGVEEIVAETSFDNRVMLQQFESRGFEIRKDRMEDIVLVRKSVVE